MSKLGLLVIPVLTMGLLFQRASAEPNSRLSAEKVNHAAIAAIPEWHGKKPKVLSHLDLTKAFGAKSQWTLVVVQDPHQPGGDFGMLQANGPVAICFVKGLAPRCSERNGSGSDNTLYSKIYRLLKDKVVFAGQNHTHPLLWLKTCSAGSADGNCDVWAALFRYKRSLDDFQPAFSYTTDGSNNNENARFMNQGPIQGDVVVDYPAAHPPYTYWIEVYAPRTNGQYKRILKYKGHTGYSDGNFLPVAYSEMPEILRRLGFWKPGDALPVPPGIHCPHPVLRHQEEWCNGQ